MHRIPEWLKANPSGNYRGAMELGAEIIECRDMHPLDFIETVRKPEENCLVLPEGGRAQISEYGIKGLAQEIVHWTRFRSDKQFVVALPSGTGTTALYLHKHLQRHNIPVITCSCVGGKSYLKNSGKNSEQPILQLSCRPTTSTISVSCMKTNIDFGRNCLILR
ncbi:pyridoxal phosphate-dependent deaminase [Vibrio ishigakensis]|uniref:Pyridoxal phosphate-dependent deaminase n=1 Tax=Vibrio ishigakensis TaxID=1481914 RepID=A0A0B8QE96_9VIBR|nr:pyridoxal phosphate-dependent deaminase [Vibrio ishigakensis]